MLKAKPSPKAAKSLLDEYNVTLGHFAERMYFIGIPAVMSEAGQDIITTMLYDNQGIGIMVGRFDEKLTMCMFSGPAGRVLGYVNPNDFLSDNEACLVNMIHDNADLTLVRHKLMYPDDEIWGYRFFGKDGKTVFVRISNTVATLPDGEKYWYMSIRRVGEYQFDNLTGGYNRLSFIRKVNKLRLSGGIDLRDYAVLFTNIRGFKAINDVYGSAVGDELLVGLYKHFLSSSLNPVLCARNESDKFLLLVKKKSLDLATLPGILRIPYKVDGKTHHADGICGIYYVEDSNTDVVEMIDSAKLAKQYIKDLSVKPYEVFTPDMKEEYLGHMNASSRFEEALENGEFHIYFQPVIDCKTGKIVSSEALVRWITEDGTIIPPASFVPALEESGNITKLDRYVYNTVAGILHGRAEMGLPLIPASVNFSRMDFFDKEAIDSLYHRIETDELVRKNLHIEITETAHHFIKDAQSKFVKRMKELGGMVYIDDFGVANSSLDMLSQFDFTILKLDMQFIKGMIDSAKVRTLVQSTINMAHAMGLRVVAEGVETKEQLDILRGFGCDLIQGYYFSKPLPRAEFKEYLETHM